MQTPNRKLVAVANQHDRPITRTELTAELTLLMETMLREIKLIVVEQPASPPRRWLKNSEVSKLLGISAQTLQNLRDNGTLPYSRIGRLFYYDPVDIDNEIERRKTRGRTACELYMKRQVAA